ncbi:MAG TPA: hypothetical protein VFL91_12190 [Thermomicrobiales bacterium]|nr:hypothetical protein [Thermomicrobiales bacterium]
MRRVVAALGLGLLAALLGGATALGAGPGLWGLAPRAAAAAGACATFAQTGKTVCDPFLSYWEDNGGLAQFGLPLTSAFNEVSTTNGRTYQVQYFERARFEEHTDLAGTPFEVELGLLGRDQLFTTYANGVPTPAAPAPALPPGTPCATFAQTGKTVCEPFLSYWQDNGGLAEQGLPLTDAFMQKSPIDGKVYLTQYFERAVFEWHPENQPPYNVLLSQLGRAALMARYPSGSPDAGMALQAGQTVLLPGFNAGGVFAATVTGVQQQPTLTDFSGQVMTATGRYEIVFLHVVNQGQQTDSLTNYSFQLKDSQGRLYAMAPAAVQYAARDAFKRNPTYTPVQPGAGDDEVAVFDIAPDAAGLTIVPQTK